MAIALALALCLAWGGLDQKVNLTDYGASAMTVVAEVQKATGVALDVDPALAGEPLVLDVKDVPVSTLLSKIALALDGQWTTRKDGSRVLVVRPAQRAEHLALRMKQVRCEVDHLAKAAHLNQRLDSDAYRTVLQQRQTLAQRATSGNTEATEALMAHDQQLPIGRAIARLVSAIDLGPVAALEPDSRVVFASRPTRMQIPIGSPSQAVLSSLNAEFSALTEAEAAVPDAFKQNPTAFLMNWGEASVLDLRKPAVRLRLVVQREPWRSPAVSFALQGIDDQGQIVIGAGLNGAIFPQSPPGLPSGLGSREPIHLSKVSLAYEDALNAAGLWPMKGGTRPVPTPEVRALILDPVEHEPLRYCGGEALVACARANGVDLVASPDDDLVEMSLLLGSHKEIPSQDFLSGTQRFSDLQLAEGFLVVRGTDPYASRLGRTPRAALRNYLRAIEGKGYATLDAKVRFALACPHLADGAMSRRFEKVLGTQIVTHMLEDFRTLRFFGSLSDGQKRSLAAGGSLPMMQLTATQRGLVGELLFKARHANLRVPDSTGRSAFREPTEVLGAGLPLEALLTMGVSHEAVTVGTALEDNGAAMHWVLDAGNAAANIVGAEQPPRATDPVTYFTRFRPASLTTYDMLLTFAPNVTLQRSLADVDVNLASPEGSWQALPDGIRKLIEAELVTQRADLAKQPARPPRRDTPPPPAPRP